MKALAIASLLLLPSFAFAQQITSVQGLGAFIIVLINNVAVPLIFALAFLVFLWGVFKYLIQGAGDQEKRKEGAQLVLWAIIGFFVMISVWGLVRILTGTFNLDSTNSVRPSELPNAPGVGSGANP